MYEIFSDLLTSLFLLVASYRKREVLRSCCSYTKFACMGTSVSLMSKLDMHNSSLTWSNYLTTLLQELLSSGLPHLADSAPNTTGNIEYQLRIAAPLMVCTPLKIVVMQILINKIRTKNEKRELYNFPYYTYTIHDLFDYVHNLYTCYKLDSSLELYISSLLSLS